MDSAGESWDQGKQGMSIMECKKRYILESFNGILKSWHLKLEALE